MRSFSCVLLGQNLQPHGFLKENSVFTLLGFRPSRYRLSNSRLLLILLGNGKYLDTPGMMGFGEPLRGVGKRIQQLCRITSCQM